MSSYRVAGCASSRQARVPWACLPARLARAVFGALLVVGVDVGADDGAASGEAAPAAKAQPAESDRKRASSWYAATVAKDDKRGFLMVHFWSKGSLFRSDAIIAGRRIVTIVDPTTYYIVDSASGLGVAIERSANAIAQDEGRGRPFANELQKLLAEGGELVGTEESEQGPVDIYRVTNRRGRRTLWMSTAEPQVPLKVETYDRATATNGQIDYLNWIHGPQIWDGFFAPDPRVELERISYEQYKQRAGHEPIGPAPVLYRQLLHGND